MNRIDQLLRVLGLSLLLMVSGCQEDQIRTEPPLNTLFTQLPATYTGISFRNDLQYTDDFNPYTFRNFYNGGGVGLGDVNRDGLIDLYLCGNQVDNQLYLNRGDWVFEDITDQAGVACEDVWSSGVSLADINGDGWLDLYVCKSGSPEGDNRHNELFINNGDPDEDGIVTFTEQAAEWGLDDVGLSSHAAFFDYDRDGDLDCYLLNNSLRSVGGYDLIPDQRSIPDTLGGNKLYRHDGDHYTDVSEEAGIYHSAIGFGLGVTIGDINRDGWLDIYVSNDFFERDYLYLNQQDGSFQEVLTEQMPEISLSSMGADLADLNHDGHPEIFVTDMLPRGDARMKTKTQFENWDKYQLNLRNGYHRQFTRNVLQLNWGHEHFSEIGRMADVYATDWSWGALMFDFDNDGFRDIFVANGIYKDLTDQDYINFFASPDAIRRLIQQEERVIQTLIDSIPSEAVSNYAFVQQAAEGAGYIPQFLDQADKLGLGEPSFSNGSVYGDLDNDGDLDLVVNNVNQPAAIYRNESDTLRPAHHWLGLTLQGKDANQYALGSRVTLVANGRRYYQELAPMRGFQSCVDPRLLIGLGTATQVDTLYLEWPDGSQYTQTVIPVDQYLSLSQGEQTLPEEAKPATRGPVGFRQVTAPNFLHQENDFQDFRRERLLFHMRSAEGPALCVGDFTGDGREDFYIGGAKYQAGALMVQQADGSFSPLPNPALSADSVSEDVECLCRDFDRDGDLDLLVATGGNELPSSSRAIRDRLYRNDGRGNLTRDQEASRAIGYRSTGALAAGDFDGDGDEDLFVGTRLRPNLIGVPGDGVLLANNGKGQFQNITQERAPDLIGLGMITAAAWADLDGDRDLDLIVAGEWMPVCVFWQEKGRFEKDTTVFPQSNGWWQSLAVADVDGNGHPDILLGNWGLNSRFHATPSQPARLYVNDFDQNGAADQIITVHQGDQAYPLALRSDLVTQMPVMKRKYLKHASYREQTIDLMFAPQQLERAVIRTVHRAESGLLLNAGNRSFQWQAFPMEAQLAPTFAWLADDLDGDGQMDILAAGNFSRAKPEVGIYAASYGTWLQADANGDWQAVPPKHTGLTLQGDVRQLRLIRTSKGMHLLVARSDGPLEMYALPVQ